MTRKRKTRAPIILAWTLPEIEAIASRDGTEILFGPRKIKIVHTVFAYEPFPERGPGRWRATYMDEVVEAALDAVKTYNLSDEMFRALLPTTFEEADRLRERVHGSRASET